MVGKPSLTHPVDVFQSSPTHNCNRSEIDYLKSASSYPAPLTEAQSCRTATSSFHFSHS